MLIVLLIMSIGIPLLLRAARKQGEYVNSLKGGWTTNIKGSVKPEKWSDVVMELRGGKIIKGYYGSTEGYTGRKGFFFMDGDLMSEHPAGDIVSPIRWKYADGK